MANATNTVPFWGYYGSGTSFDYDPASTGPGSQFLEALRKIDPNASFVRGQSGGGEGGPGQDNWTLQTTAHFPGVDLNSGDYGPQYWQPRDGSYSQQQYGHDYNTNALIDPNLTHSDPVFGTYTDQSNTRQTSSLLDYLGPAAVGAFGLLMGGMPALYQGVFGQGAYGGGASGLGASDPFLNGGTGAMDVSGSAGTGIPGSFGANAPLGSAESSLFGTGVQTAPETAFGGTPFDLSQAAAPIVDQGVPATVGDSLRNGALPSLGSVARSAGSLLPALRAASGLLGGAKPSGGGGGIGLLGGGGGSGPGGEDAASIIARYYGEDPLTKLRNRMRNG